MPEVDRRPEVNNDSKKLDFSRDGRVYVERYSAEELANIARLMKHRKAFDHLLKRSRVIIRQEEKPLGNHQSKKRVKATLQKSPLKMVIRMDRLSSSSSSDDSEESNDEDNGDEPFVDDEIFSKVFKPIRTIPVTPGTSSSNVPQNSAVQKKHSQPIHQDPNGGNRRPRSPIGLEQDVDEETFNKSFKKIPLTATKSNATEVDPNDKLKHHQSTATKSYSGASVLFAPMSIDSKKLDQSTEIFTRETNKSATTEKEESLNIQAAVNNLVISVVQMDDKGKRDESLVSIVDPFASAGLKNYLKQVRDSKAVPPKLLTPKLEPVDLPEASTIAKPSTSSDPSPTKGRLRQAHKRPVYLNDFCNGIIPGIRKADPPRVQPPVVEKPKTPAPEPTPQAGSSNAAGTPMNQKSSADDLVFHTTDARTDPEWRDSKASRVLRKSLLFVKKGGRVSVSRYEPNFASVTVTQNAAIYAASAITSAAELIAREQRDKPSTERLPSVERGHSVNPQGKTDQSNAPIRHRSLPVRRLSPAADVPLTDSAPQAASNESSPETLATTRRGRMIKQASRFSDYFVGNARLPTKRRDRGKEPRVSKAVEICPERCDENHEVPINQRLSEVSVVTLNSTPLYIVKRQRSITQGRDNPRKSIGDCGSNSSSIDPFMSSGDEDENVENEEIPEQKYIPPSDGVLDQRLEDERSDQVQSIAPLSDGTIAPVMFVADVATRLGTIPKITSTHSIEESNADLANEVDATLPSTSVLKDVQLRRVLIDPAMGLTSPDELHAIMELNRVLYEGPRTVNLNQLMKDLKTSLAIELRNHEQLIRWKKFLTLRRLEMIERLKMLAAAHIPHCTLPHRIAYVERVEPSGNASSSTEAASTFSSNRSRGQTLPSGSVFLTPEPPANRAGIKAKSGPSPVRVGSQTGKITTGPPLKVPPPSLTVHPIDGQTLSIAPVSLIIPTGQTFKLPSSLASASPTNRVTSGPHLGQQRSDPTLKVPPVVAQEILRTGKIVLKSVARNVVGSPPRIIRRLIPINRTLNNNPIVTPLSLTSNPAPTFPGVSILRKMAPNSDSNSDLSPTTSTNRRYPVTYQRRPARLSAKANPPDNAKKIVTPLSSVGPTVTPMIHNDTGIVRASTAGGSPQKRRRPSLTPTDQCNSMPPPNSRPPKAKSSVTP